MADWFCWHVGTVSDPKFTLVARKANVPRILVISVWSWLLERAKASDQPGTFGKFDHEDAAITLEIEPAQVTATLSAFKDKGMISETKIINWDKRQHNATSKERTRAWRDRKRHAEALHDVTDSHGDSGDVTERLVTAQDRTGQDITKIYNTVPVTARANGSNGHGHKNGNGSKIDFDPLRASRALNGEPSKAEKHEKFEARTLQFARAHCPDLVPEMIRLQLSADPNDQKQRKQVFNQVDAEFQSRSKAGTLIEGWKDY